jgi:Tol biopolymer transport system component
MNLTPGTRLGVYEIVGFIGAGGMGEVYRARDTKLDRQVAIKMLPPVFADDPERRPRFEREARTLASLNHPNIAQIYGVQESAGHVAIVMELVEGEDLAERIKRGALTWTDARPIARQIAEALDAAHERGIIHRDLKPANIRITPEESVKILDFGLAKAVAGDAAVADPALSPTITAGGTHTGTIIGTAAYMAPEQAKGQAVDKRADIWAFGVILFEMLTGRSPFAADSAVESLGLLMTKDPDWSALRSSIPAHIVGLVKRCLVKSVKGRLRDIGDAMPALTQDVAASDAGALRPTNSGRILLVASALGLILAAAAAAVAWSLKPSAAPPLRRVDLPDAVATSRSIAISPDGGRYAYANDGRIYVRELAQTEAHEIWSSHPTLNYLFWSPDGRTLGFYAEGTIRTVPAAGGPMFTVCQVPVSRQVTSLLWHPDGRIIFAVWRDNMYSVRATGGTPEILLAVDVKNEIDFHETTLTPDGRLVTSVHLRESDLARLELVDLRSRKRTVLTDDGSVRDFKYARPDHLLFRRVDTNVGLWALPFSESTLDLSRAALLSAGATAFSISNEGTAIVQADVVPSFTLQWVSRDGSSASTAGPPIENLLPWIALSPDGSRVVYVAGRTQPVIFVRDLSTGTDTRVASGGMTGLNAALGAASTLMHPGWFPSGDRVVYTKGQIEASKVQAWRADGSGDASTLATGTYGRVSSDGKWLLWLEDNRGMNRLRYATFDGTRAVGESRTPPGLEPINIRSFDLSPDGKLLAYSATEESTQWNVHIMAFPGGSPRRQVTSGGGTFPQFSGNGRELYFFSGRRGESGALEGMLMTAAVTTGTSLSVGVPRVLFSGAATPSGFDVARDGRLLVSRRTVRSGERPRALLVENWPLLFKGSLSGGR